MTTRLYDSAYHHNRNYGCRWQESVWKGYRSVVMENEKLRTTILVDKGTDIVELLYKPRDIDFMWQSPMEVQADRRQPLSKELTSGSFLDFYEGGWQELLPSITTPTNYMGMNLGLHGEVAFLSWDYQILEDSPDEVSIRFSVRMKRSPLLVHKTITLKSQCSVIEFQETVKNEGDQPFSLMWGHHPAYGKPFLDEHCVIDLPPGAIGETYQVDFSGNSPFECGVEFDWPMATDKQGRLVDLSRIMSPDRKIAFNVYIKGVREGWYGITNPVKGVGIGFTWDIDLFKYLLLWSVYRGFFNCPFYGRTYNVALELYSAIPDSLDEVMRLGRDIRLEPQAEISTRFATIVYETDRRIRGFTPDHDVM